MNNVSSKPLIETLFTCFDNMIYNLLALKGTKLPVDFAAAAFVSYQLKILKLKNVSEHQV